MPVLKLLR